MRYATAQTRLVWIETRVRITNDWPDSYQITQDMHNHIMHGEGTQFDHAVVQSQPREVTSIDAECGRACPTSAWMGVGMTKRLPMAWERHVRAATGMGIPKVLRRDLRPR